MLVSSFYELCLYLRTVKAKRLYLIHEPNRERETRDFAMKLRKENFIPLVASDYRIDGEEAVKEAIKSSDISVVVAYDLETIRKAKELGVVFVSMEV